MKQKSSVDIALKNWALTYNLAEQNPTLLIRDGAKYSDICAKRMEDVEYWETELLSLLTPEHSEQAAAWLKARLDKGCDGCWISSSRISQHAECQEKINAYFRAHENLVDLGISI